MKNLTPEQIRFIDTYLKNSGVEFLDIRVEMIDHVASSIEDKLEEDETLNFYDAFKSYMVLNKKSLLKSANRAKWSVDFKVLVDIKKELLKTPLLFTGFGLTAVLYKVEIARLENSRWFLIPLAIVIITAYFIPVILNYKLKISFLNRLSVYAYLMNYMFYLMSTYFEPAADWLSVGYGLLIWANLGVLLTAFKMSAYYKKQFASI
jgi:hypothetical protein